MLFREDKLAQHRFVGAVSKTLLTAEERRRGRKQLRMVCDLVGEVGRARAGPTTFSSCLSSSVRLRARNHGSVFLCSVLKEVRFTLSEFGLFSCYPRGGQWTQRRHREDYLVAQRPCVCRTARRICA